MKVTFTKKEVEHIVLEFVQRNLAKELNSVHFSHYSIDYCTVTVEQPEETTTTE